MKSLKLVFALFLLSFGWAEVNAQAIGLSMPDSSGQVGDTLLYPILVDSSLTGRQIFSYQVEINFNSFYYQVLGVETAGTISSGISVSSNTLTPGRALVAGAGANPLVGTGPLVYLKVKLLNPINPQAFTFSGADRTYFNEGSPAILTQSGTIGVDPLPNIVVQSLGFVSELILGEQLGFTASGGQPPYTYSLTNPAIGNIDSSGVFVPTSQGKTRVRAEDANGVVGTSTQDINVSSFRFVRKDTTIFQRQTFSYPLTVSDLSGLGVNSGEFTLGFNGSVLSFLGVEKNGSLLQNSEVSFTNLGSQTKIAFSGTQDLTGNGTLLNILFEAADVGSSGSSLSITTITFNEDISGFASNSNIGIAALPTISIQLPKFELLADESMQANASNTTGPLMWRVSDTTKASINETGLVTAIRSGTFQVVVEDSLGAIGNSSNVQIFDILFDVIDTTSFAGDTLLMPLRISNLDNSRALSAVEFDFNYDPNLLEFLGVETISSLSEGWAFSSNPLSTSQITVAGAGSNQVSVNGDLLYLKFIVKTASFNNQSTAVNFVNNTVLFNEGFPISKNLNGSVTITTLPLKTVLKLPNTDSLNTPTELTFEWQKSRGADYYQIQVSRNQFFSDLFKDSTQILTESVLFSGLENNRTYFWRVRGINSFGEGTYSDVNTFTTIIAPPSAPTLQSPSNQQVNVDTTALFQWTSSLNADSYNFQLSSDSSFTNLMVDSTLIMNEITLKSLAFGTSYLWRVRASNLGGSGDFSEPFSFTTTSGLPSLVTLSSPVNGSTNVPILVNFEWNSAALAESYQIQVSELGDFSTTVLDSTTTNLTLGYLLAFGNQYNWRVRGLNTQGSSESWSDVFSFSTTSGLPDSVSLVSPLNGATNLSPLVNFVWNTANLANSFQIQISNVADFSTTMLDSSLVDTTLQFQLEYGNQYNWRVRGLNAQGSSESWSEVFSFSTQIDFPEIPVLLSPQNESSSIDTALTLLWSNAQRADSFYVQLSTDLNFTQIQTELSVKDTTAFLAGLNFLTDYYWRVKAKNSTGESEFSSVFKFTTGNEPILPPTIVNKLGIVTFNEDFENQTIADLDTVFSDPKNLSLSYSLLSYDSTVVSISLNGNLLSASSLLNQFGNVAVVVSAQNSAFATTFDTLLVNILSVNDLPTIINLPDSIRFNSEEVFELRLDSSFFDVEDEVSSLFIELSVEPTAVILDYDATNLIATISAPGFGGEGLLRILVRDTDGGEITATIPILVELITSNEDRVGVPLKFALSQNYPNPFNPTTNITFDIPESSNVRLEVFDMLGRKVISLVNERKAAGSYTVKLDASSLSSGMYIYQLQAGAFIQTRKLTLIK